MPASRTEDPAGSPLAAVLNAQRRSEDWGARRTLAGRAVILLSLPLAYLAVGGAGLATGGARLVVAIWSMALAGLAACGMVELRARQVVDRLLRRTGGQRFKSAS